MSATLPGKLGTLGKLDVLCSSARIQGSAAGVKVDELRGGRTPLNLRSSIPGRGRNGSGTQVSWIFLGFRGDR